MILPFLHRYGTWDSFDVSRPIGQIVFPNTVERRRRDPLAQTEELVWRYGRNPTTETFDILTLSPIMRPRLVDGTEGQCEAILYVSQEYLYGQGNREEQIQNYCDQFQQWIFSFSEFNRREMRVRDGGPATFIYNRLPGEDHDEWIRMAFSEPPEHFNTRGISQMPVEFTSQYDHDDDDDDEVENSEPAGDLTDRIANSNGIRRLTGETDRELQQRIADQLNPLVQGTPVVTVSARYPIVTGDELLGLDDGSAIPAARAEAWMGNRPVLGVALEDALPGGRVRVQLSRNGDPSSLFGIPAQSEHFLSQSAFPMTAQQLEAAANHFGRCRTCGAEMIRVATIDSWDHPFGAICEMQLSARARRGELNGVTDPLLVQTRTASAPLRRGQFLAASGEGLVGPAREGQPPVGCALNDALLGAEVRMEPVYRPRLGERTGPIIVDNPHHQITITSDTADSWSKFIIGKKIDLYEPGKRRIR